MNMRTATFTRRALALLVSLILLMASACGKAAPGSRTDAADAKTAAEAETANRESTDTATEDGETQTDGTEPEETESMTEEPEPVPTEDPAVIRDAANTSLQAANWPMAFDDSHIYFTADKALYRCNYDGSEVTRLEKDLSDITISGGKLWGAIIDRSGSFDEEGLYSMDLETGEMTQVIKMDASPCGVVLVSGKWLCYGQNGRGLVLHDLTNGEEKVISEPFPADESVDVVEMCLYGKTLYAIVGSTVKGEMRYEYTFCSYELDSGAETMTRLVDKFPGGRTTSFWMEDGLLLIEPDTGAQYYDARFADIADGTWNYRQEEKKVGTDMTAAGTEEGLNDKIRNAFNARYLLGDGLLLIEEKRVQYFPDMDFSAPVLVWDQTLPRSAYRLCHGIHDGAVYLLVEKDGAAPGEILKITEGGVVEHIPITLP